MKSRIITPALFVAAGLGYAANSAAQAPTTTTASAAQAPTTTTAADSEAFAPASARGDLVPQADSSSAASTEVLPTIPVPVAKDDIAPVRQGSEDTAGIAEVVVTARRVSESMQEVPVAISAMSAEDIEREKIDSPQGLQGRIPSLSIGTNSQTRSTESLTIRGQGAQFGTSPGVIIYFAEVPLPADLVINNQGGPGKFFDLSNIQVLKGSQGTLFGRNTTGGALLLEPQRPSNEFSASLRAEGTTYSGQGYEAFVNLPIVDRTVLVRGGFKFFERDGFTHDVVTGKDYDDKHYWTSRLGITWRPMDEINNYLVGYYTENNDNGTGNVIEDINRKGLNQAIPGFVGLGALTQIPGLDVSQIANIGCVLIDVFGPSPDCGQNILDEQHARGHRHVQLSADPTDKLLTGGVIDNFSYDLTDQLTVRNIASYSSFRHQYRLDQDGSRGEFDDFNNANNVYNADLRTVTEELQLQGKALDGNLKFALGGYYEHTSASGIITASALFFERIYQEYEETKYSYAPFAQGTYDLGGLFDKLSGLNLTIGARYTTDKSSGDAILQQTILGAVRLVDNNHHSELSSSAPTYTVGLDYKWGDTLVYGKISRGYKTGGLSVVAVNPHYFTYDPEYVTNYEIGQKSDFKIGNMPTRINSAVYYTDYTDLQKTGIDSYKPPVSLNPLPQLGASVYNVGKATVYGFEIDGTIQPFRGFTFVASYSYTHAQYDKFTLLYGGVTPQHDCSGQSISAGDTAELSCEPFQSSPENQFSLSPRYLLPVDASVGDIEISATYTWVDRSYSGQTTLPEDEPGAWLPSAGLLNASLSWNHIFGSAFDAQLFGTNLANKEYRVSNSNQWNLTYFRASIYSEPRIIGLQLGYKWGH